MGNTLSDPILYWNDVALEANRVSHTNGKNEQTGPTLSSRALAIVHLAMYDAYAGVRCLDKTPTDVDLSPFLPNLPAPAADASSAAAVAAAAHATLSSLFPSQKPFFDEKHAAAPGLQTSDPRQSGHNFGLLVAQKILELRKGDPGVSDDGYAASQAPGAHRADPANSTQGFYSPFYGSRSRTFAVTSRHRLDPPPQLGTPQYLDALCQVRAKGIAPELAGTLPENLRSEFRTPAETLIGMFWAYDGARELGTPPRLYNQIVRTLAMYKQNKTEQNARLLALVNAAMADAGILAWEQKNTYNLWRPVLGIREGDRSLGPAGEAGNEINEYADPLWLPLGAPKSNSTTMEANFTPNFPAYPSGHATFGAAALHMARMFYGVHDLGEDELIAGIPFVSEELNGLSKDNKGVVRPRLTRKFPGGLWQMIVENGLSRVFLGVHWEFDAFLRDEHGNPDLSKNVGGVPLGINIAEDIFKNGLNYTALQAGNA